MGSLFHQGVGGSSGASGSKGRHRAGNPIVKFFSGSAAVLRGVFGVRCGIGVRAFVLMVGVCWVCGGLSWGVGGSSFVVSGDWCCRLSPQCVVQGPVVSSWEMGGLGGGPPCASAMLVV